MFARWNPAAEDPSNLRPRPEALCVRCGADHDLTLRGPTFFCRNDWACSNRTINQQQIHREQRVRERQAQVRIRTVKRKRRAA